MGERSHVGDIVERKYSDGRGSRLYDSLDHRLSSFYAREAEGGEDVTGPGCGFQPQQEAGAVAIEECIEESK